MNIQLLRDEDVTQVVGGDFSGFLGAGPISVSIIGGAGGKPSIMVFHDTLGLLVGGEVVVEPPIVIGPGELEPRTATATTSLG